MRKARPLALVLATGAVLLSAMLTGCRNPAWYEERAVARAREFLLENAPELSVDQQAFVRYNLPVLLVENIFGGYGPAVSDACQICVTWLIPGAEDAYLVFGVSDMRMQSWYPNRLIRKTFKSQDLNYCAAVATARKYAQNGLFYDLTAHEINCVRFNMPQLYLTNFDLALNPDGTVTEEALVRRQELLQFSLAWAPRDGTELVVISGLAAPDLSGFAVYGGGLMNPETLAKHTEGRHARSMPVAFAEPELVPEPPEGVVVIPEPTADAEPAADVAAGASPETPEAAPVLPEAVPPQPEADNDPVPSDEKTAEEAAAEPEAPADDEPNKSDKPAAEAGKDRT